MLELNSQLIHDNARAFSKRYAQATKENAESQTFLNEFFAIFGLDRKSYAFFEFPIKLSGETGSKRIDCLAPALLLIEMKSAGESLDKAYLQAKRYVSGLSDNEKPRYILVSDLQNFALYDANSGSKKSLVRFALADLVNHLTDFSFLWGATSTIQPIPESMLNIFATKLLSEVHDALEDERYKGHFLQVFMTRILFCLYAEDTGIFEDRIFTELVEKNPSDGQYLGAELNSLFSWLNTDDKARKKQQKPTALIAKFPYVNGGLFVDELPTTTLSSTLYKALLDCCYFYWGNIDPVIFGSLFQGLEDSEERRAGGQHYTAENNILRALNPLFLDRFKQQLTTIKQQAGELKHKKNGAYTAAINRIAKESMSLMTEMRALTLLDPACGSGNFLILAYRELRRIELELLILQQTISGQSQSFDELRPLINLNQFYGIEINDWAAQIANVAMIITQHQMNLEFIAANISDSLPNFLPLSQQANIVLGNAMSLSWSSIINPKSLHFIVGNPPFIGKQYRSTRQSHDMDRVLASVPDKAQLKHYKNLDYVILWHIKATLMMKRNQKIEAAFVSTNSICQGEQVPAFWMWMQAQGVHINFAHRTFQWTNEDKQVGIAAVHCIIVGFSKQNRTEKRLFSYDNIKGEPSEKFAHNISPYLIDAPTVFVTPRTKPLGYVSMIAFGSMANDDGHLLLTQTEKDELVQKEPLTEKYIRTFLGAQEFLNAVPRYCLWLVGCTEQELALMPLVGKRVDAIKKMRLKSTREATRKLAVTPMLFGEIRQPTENYLLIPRVSSENRDYVPIGYLSKNVICSDANLTVSSASICEFGILTSAMHNAWMRTVSGKLKSDYRYSGKIVYNTFPWVTLTTQQKNDIESAAQSILDVRANYPDQSLAWLYNVATMPNALKVAHLVLDKLVDRLYGLDSNVINKEADRIAVLFKLYQKCVGLDTKLMPVAIQVEFDITNELP
jgi:hypothetical protein